MKMPFEWVVGDSSKGLHGDRAHVYDGGGAVTVNYTTLRGTTTPGRRVLWEPLCASQGGQASFGAIQRCVHRLFDAARRSEGL